MKTLTKLSAALLAVSLSSPALSQGLSEAEIDQRIRDYLLDNPEVVVEAIQRWQQQQQQAETQQYQQALASLHDEIYNNPDTPVMGNPDGDVAVVEFLDYNCGYCRRAFNDVMALADRDGDVRILMKEFPILGPGSQFASQAALAAREQGLYAEFHSAMMSASGQLDEARVLAIASEVGLDADQLRADMDNPDIQAALQRNHTLARRLGISGTPGFIVGDEIVRGAVGLDHLQRLVDTTRSAGG